MSSILLYALLIALLLPGLSLALDDTKTDGPLTLAASAVESKSWDMALRYFKAAQKAQPDNPAIIFNTALTLDHLDWHQLDAIVWYRAYLAGAPYAENAEEVVKRIIELEQGAYGNAQLLISKAQMAVTGLPARKQDVGRANIAGAQARVGNVEGAIDQAIITMQPHEKDSMYFPFLWRLVDSLREGGDAARAAQVLFDTDDAALVNLKAYPIISDLIRQGRRDLALYLSRSITVPDIRDMALVRTMLAQYYWEGTSALAIADEILPESRAFGLLSMAHMAIRGDDTVTARAALLSAIVPALQAPLSTARLYLLSSIAGLQSRLGDPIAQHTLAKAREVGNDDNPNWEILRKVWFEGWSAVHREALEAEQAKNSLTAREVREWIRQHATSENSTFAGLYKLTDGAIRIVDKVSEIRSKAQQWQQHHDKALVQ